MAIATLGVLSSLGCAKVESGAGGQGGAAGSGGVSGSGGSNRLAVVATNPEDGATDVDPSTTVAITFSEALDVSSVDSSTFSLAAPAEPALPATVSVESSTTAVMELDEPLALLASYTATAAASITGVGGGTLESEATWSFRVRDGAWRDAAAIDSNATANNIVVTFDDSGVGTAVWNGGDNTSLQASRYHPEIGWSAPQPITNASSVSPRGLGADQQGNLILVWLDSSTTDAGEIWASRYTSGDGWDVPERISDPGDADRPQLAVEPSGGAIAVWEEDPSPDFAQIWASRYAPGGGGWGDPERIDAGNAGRAIFPRVELDVDGNALAVWQQSDGTRDNIVANRFTPVGGWGSPAPIESNIGDAFGPSVGIDDSGRGIAVWTQSVGSDDQLWFNRFAPSEGWGEAEAIQAQQSAIATTPVLAVNGAGAAFAAWSELETDRFDHWAARYTPEGGWASPQRIEADNAGSAFPGGIGVDPNGNALVVWYQSDGTRNNILGNRYEVGAGWNLAVVIDSGDEAAVSPRLAVDRFGRALAVWPQAGQAVANRFE